MVPNDPRQQPEAPAPTVPEHGGTAPKQSRSPRRLIATSALAAGLAVGGFGVAAAASGGSGATTTPSASGQSGSSASGGTGAPAPGDWRGPGRPMRGGPGGTVTAISGSTVTFTGPDGQSRSVTTDSSTVYRKDGTTVPASALAVGEHIAVRPVRPATGSSSSSTSSSTTPVAAEIDIMSPTIDGTVHSVSGSTLVIVDQQGFWRTVDVAADATVTRGGQASSLSAVKVGDHVRAAGTIASDNTTLDATSVQIQLPHVGGQVTSVTGTTITVTGPGGTTWTIDTTAPTTFTTASGPGSTTASSLSAVTSGSFVDAAGTLQGTTLTATSVTVRTGTAGFAGPRGRGGPSGFGPGPMGGPGASGSGSATAA